MPKIMYNDKNYSMGTGEGIVIDTEINSMSENPVQNKVIADALDTKLNIGDIADWAKADEKPIYTANEVGADIQGSAGTALSSAKSYTDTKISDLINGAPETLDTLGEIAEAMTDNKDVVEALDAAIGSKANASDLTTHINNKNNPHNVTKLSIGLGNVENKSSADIRGELTKNDVTAALGYTPPTANTTYNNATQSAAGLESAADKTKLDSIETGANKYSLPVATSSVRGGVKIGYTANGKNYPVQLSNEQMYVNVPWTDTNTTYSNFVKSGSGAKAGLVPAPSTTAGTTKYLREDGTWQVPPDSNTVYTHPTTSGNKHIPSGGSSGQILRWSADGTAVWGADNNTTYSAVTSSANGLATPALLSAANNALPKSGGTMTGALVAQSNNNYTTAQTRNVIISANAPSGTVPDGTIWYQYE